MKTSKILEIHDVKGDGKLWRGTYYHNLELENGDKINIGKKRILNDGDDIDYVITGDVGQHEFTKARTPNLQESPLQTTQKKDDYVKGIEVGHAVNNAVNMICAGVEWSTTELDHLPTEAKIKEYARKIMSIANELKNENN